MTKVVGVIHAKGSSERVFRKNFCLIDSTPLFLCQAINLGDLIGRDNVYIDSEDQEALELATINGFRSLKRDERFSSNKTGGVRLLRNFAEQIEDCDVIVQMFPPMPLVDRTALSHGLEAVTSDKYNSAAFFITTSEYKWSGDQPAYSFNDGEIPNSVDLEKSLIELPTVYIVKRPCFLESGRRLVHPVLKMCPSVSYNKLDIDYSDDFDLVRSVYDIQAVAKNYQFGPSVRTFVPPIIFWDIDGTLTDGHYPMAPTGEAFKNFNTYDGIAFKDLAEMGIINCLVTASKSTEIIEARAKMLNANALLDCGDKVQNCKDFAEASGYNLRECFFVGNDINDLEAMQASGRAFCPWDSHSAVLKSAEVLPTPGRIGLARSLYQTLRAEKYLKRIT